MRDDHFSKQTTLRWRGARAAAVSAIAGSLLFMLVDFLPIVGDNHYLDGWSIIVMIVIFAVLAGLFALPFALVAGYLLGWFLERTQWHLTGYRKSITAGAIFAAISIIVIFAIGGIFQTCLASHGMCDANPIGYTWGVISSELVPGSLSVAGQGFIKRFVEALFIAAIAGAITGYYLCRQESRPTPRPPDGAIAPQG